MSVNFQSRTSALFLLLLLGGVIFLSGCEFEVQPLGGVEGRTQVYVAAGKLGAPNAGIICTSDGCVVIDPMLSPTIGANLQTQALAKSRVFWDNKHAAKKEKARTQAPPVLYVLNTTFRASHTFGNQEFDKADIISTTKARDRLIADGAAMREELRDRWKVPGLEGHYSAAARLTVDGQMTLNTPEVAIQFISMGDCVGEGDAVVYLPGQRVLFAGDLVIPNYIPYFRGRSLTVRNWIEALKKLETFEIETIVPGHGEIIKRDAKAAIRSQREFLEALVAEVSKAVAAGQSADQAAQSVKLQQYARWARYDEWFAENVKLVHQELTQKDKKDKVSNSGAGAGAVKPAAVEPRDAFNK